MHFGEGERGEKKRVKDKRMQLFCPDLLLLKLIPMQQDFPFPTTDVIELPVFHTECNRISHFPLWM